jgi:chromosome segregation ATPase
MNKEQLKNILFFFLISITVVSVFKYLSTLRDNYTIQDELNKAKVEVSLLAQEKQNLLQQIGKEKTANIQLLKENASLKGNLRAGKRRMDGLFRQVSGKETELDDVNAKLAVLKAENKALIQSHNKITQQNQEFKFKFNSLVELKKAIRNIKLRGRKDVEMDKGNRGYLIKNGQPTAKVKIEVVPAQSSE